VSTSGVFFSTTTFVATASSEAREDNEVDEGEDLGLSRGETLAEEAGVESVVVEVAIRRSRTASLGTAVDAMVGKWTRQSNRRRKGKVELEKGVKNGVGQELGPLQIFVGTPAVSEEGGADCGFLGFGSKTRNVVGGSGPATDKTEHRERLGER
jgi:hypothetical protein